MPPYSWLVPAAGHIHKGQQGGMLKLSQMEMKRPALSEALMSRHPAMAFGLVGQHAHAAAADSGKAGDHVLRVVGLDPEEIGVNHHAEDDLFHIMRVLELSGITLLSAPQMRLTESEVSPPRSGLHIVQQIAHQLADGGQGLGLGGVDEVGHTGGGVVGHGAAQLLCGDVLAGDGFDDLGTGDEHVGGLIHHEDEVGEGGE